MYKSLLFLDFFEVDVNLDSICQILYFTHVDNVKRNPKSISRPIPLLKLKEINL